MGFLMIEIYILRDFIVAGKFFIWQEFVSQRNLSWFREWSFVIEELMWMKKYHLRWRLLNKFELNIFQFFVLVDFFSLNYFVCIKIGFDVEIIQKIRFHLQANKKNFILKFSRK